MFRTCKQATTLVLSSYSETALISGVSDIVVVKWADNLYKTSPFLVCFGSLSFKAQQEEIKIKVNGRHVQNLGFVVNKYGYMEPFQPDSHIVASLNLRPGRNTICFSTSRMSLYADLFVYSLTDRIILSDMDGTMTKTDLMGLLSNYRGLPYLHDGYEMFVRELVRKGYKMVWITMRSIALYGFSKKYIDKYVGCEGALLPEPEQFFPSLKKQVLRHTGNVKTNIIRKIRDLFPPEVNPFAGGLGNRENDAIAYRAVGVPAERIYLISESSQIMTLAKLQLKGYTQLHQEIESYFPDCESKPETRPKSEPKKGKLAKKISLRGPKVALLLSS